MKLSAISILLALPLGIMAQAQDTAHLDSISRQFDLDAVVVTGTRTPKFLKDTPIQTRVITAKDIARLDATNVQDLLQQELPGVEFSFAMNQQTHLNFSGFGGQGVLFLVDGERLAGETMDDVDFTRLTMNNVERIEIVKGAASALYGSSATGGVINIITKRNRQPWTLNVNARYARHNEQRYGLSFGLNGKHWNNTLTANYNRMDNYDVHNGPAPVSRNTITTVYGDKTLNLKDQLTWTPAHNIRLTGRAGYFFRERARTNAYQPERYRDFNGGLKMDWDITENDVLQLNYAFDQYDKSDYQRIAKLDIRDYSNVQNTFRLLYNHSFERGDVLTVGSDFLHDYLYNTNMEGNTRRQDVFDAFAQYDWRVSKHWELVGALRYDYFSDGDLSQVTPKLNVCYKPLHNLAIRAGYGMGFRAPALKEKYYNFDMAGIWIVEGNPDLKPERSHNFNVSAEYTVGHYNITASTYYNKVNNKLAMAAPYRKSDGQLYCPYTNLSNYSVCGGEIGAQARWNNGFSARLTYAYTHEQLNKDKEGNALASQYIPARKHAVNARVDYDHQFTRTYGLNAGLNGRLLSGVDNMEYVDYYDVSKGTNKVNYPAYTLWKLSLVHRFGKAIKVTTAIDNLFNYKPEYYYYNCPLTDGINLQVGVAIDVDKLF